MIVATLSLFGTPEAVSMPQAFLIRTAAGGVFVMKVKERSSNTVITTGIIRPASFFVLSLGRDCEVISPKEFREEMINELKAALKNYK